MKYIIGGLAFMICVAVALGIIPGLDILAWHILNPTTFAQKFLIVALEILTMWARVILGFAVVSFGGILSAAVIE